MFYFDALPDETLLETFLYLRHKNLGRCLQVSKRFNQIAKDMRLWRKITLWNRSYRRMSAKFFIEVLDYGLENYELTYFLFKYSFQLQRNLDFEIMAVENQDQSILQKIIVKNSDQELSLKDLPDEILMKIFMYLRPKYLGRFRQVSKRLNHIAKDKRLWRNITLWNRFYRKISADFFTQALHYGLEKLELRKCEVKGVMKRPERNQLKSLNLQWLNFYKRSNAEFVSNLFENCQFLENLFIKGFGSLKLDFQKLTINGQLLKKINISFRTYVWWTQNSQALTYKAVVLIVNNCRELSELALSNITRPAVEYLCKNLTPKICKLHLDSWQKEYLYLPEYSVDILSKRCDKLTALSLGFIKIPRLALSYLKNLMNLEKLAFFECFVNETYNWKVWIGEFDKMTKLKVLCISYIRYEPTKQKCKQRLSNLENLTMIFDQNFLDQKKLMDIAVHTGPCVDLSFIRKTDYAMSP